MQPTVSALGISFHEVEYPTTTHTKYTILAKSRNQLYEYKFIPNEFGFYSLDIDPVVNQSCHEKIVDETTVLYWSGTSMHMRNQDEDVVVFDVKTGKFTLPERLFTTPQNKNVRGITWIIFSDAVSALSLIEKGKTIAFADEWEEIPAAIPEDVVILDKSTVSLRDIVLRLPPNKTAKVVRIQPVKAEQLI